MGKLAGLLGAGISLAVEVSKSRSPLPSTGQPHDSSNQNPRASASALSNLRSQRPNPFAGYLESDYEPDNGRRSLDQSSRTTSRRRGDHSDCVDGDFRSIYDEKKSPPNTSSDGRMTDVELRCHEDDYDSSCRRQNQRPGDQRYKWQRQEMFESIGSNEPASYAAATEPVIFSVQGKQTI